MERYVLDTGRFAVDELDGETMLMDLMQGRLVLWVFGSAKLWPWLSSGMPVTVLFNHVTAQEGKAATEDFSQIVNRLVSMGALVPAAIDFPPGSLGEGDLPGGMGRFVISEYDDISTIVTMDPIHDVDPERGWPFDGTS